MKTFKLVSLRISHPTDFVESQEITLVDGLVINKEDEERQWLLEGFMDKKYQDLFTKLKDAEREVKLQAVISREDNDPATFITTIQSITAMEDNVSVLFHGVLFGKADISEGILTALIGEGLHGNKLLLEFRKRISDKKTISN